MNAIVRQGVAGGYPQAVGIIRTVSWKLAEQVGKLCQAGATIDAALERLRDGARFARAEDATWFRQWVEWIRGQLRSAGLDACNYVSSPYLERDVFAEVLGRSGNPVVLGFPSDVRWQGSAARVDPAQIPPLPPLREDCEEDGGGGHGGHGHDDDGDEWTGGGGGACGGGACGGNCGGAGGCGWNVKLPGPGESPCIFDHRPMKRIDLRKACAQLGRANCEPVANDVAPCQIDKIVRQTRRWFASGTTLAGTVVVVPADEAHDVPAGFTMYALELAGIPLSHKLCLREVTITLISPTDPALAVEPTLVGLEAVKLFCDSNGGYVHAYDWPEFEEDQYISITSGRCACAKLCICVPQGESARILFLIPTPAAGLVVSVLAKGTRECFGILCGDCPPSPLCGRTLEA